ncbi:MAG: hypothetical protein JWR03_2140 [Cohnella sp.]|jgi:hypothetical protein|nr:hypothetical protein [Cohnella sp.]
MTLYTAMPLELVLDGFGQEPGPFIDLTIRGVTMRVLPIAPGIGKIERLLDAPLDCYLKPEFSPGQTVSYTEDTGNAANAWSTSDPAPFPA